MTEANGLSGDRVEVNLRRGSAALLLAPVAIAAGEFMSEGRETVTQHPALLALDGLVAVAGFITSLPPGHVLAQRLTIRRTPPEDR